jgi:hypothetical protein
MPGFGPLELTEEIRQEIARMIGRSLGEKAPDVPRPWPRLAAVRHSPILSNY